MKRKKRKPTREQMAEFGMLMPRELMLDVLTYTRETQKGGCYHLSDELKNEIGKVFKKDWTGLKFADICAVFGPAISYSALKSSNDTGDSHASATWCFLIGIIAEAGERVGCDAFEDFDEDLHGCN